ncbi:TRANSCRIPTIONAL REGULATOR [Salix koriyanagi]|uniref:TRANSCRIPTIONAL REGULATOR n=1 Tax=Salix koriyanagi TaxID=2511006 RepID=A0A9Q1A5B2_9ROSI|nr:TRANSCRIPTIONAL REGULATOR [Salix koriyanagi]
MKKVIQAKECLLCQEVMGVCWNSNPNLAMHRKHCRAIHLARKSNPNVILLPTLGTVRTINPLSKKIKNGHFSRIKEVGEHKEALSTKLDSASNKPGRGYAWLNKSSWTQLVSGNNGNAFSITQILPGVSFANVESSKPDGLEVLGSMKSMHDDISKKSNIDPTVDGTLAFGFRKEGNVQNRVEMSPQIVGGNAEASAPVVKKTTSETKPAYTRDVSIGESCSFMRTADSVKEWARTKAALSGSRKRKNNEK